ncbi:MAG: CapA family protein [Gammaproteobacteria bacterium]
MSDTVTICLCGDVMTGRGIDQVLPHSGSPELRETYVRDARDYVKLAEAANGPIARPVGFRELWGDVPAALRRVRADALVINLETSITTSDDFWPDKGVHYRMHPANVAALGALHPSCCVLANNHVLDFGYTGLEETLETLQRAGLVSAGAGRDAAEAAAPAIVHLPAGAGRLLVFAFGAASSGIPRTWAADVGKAGVSLLRDLSPSTARRVVAAVERIRQPRDIVVASIHWGGNWGYTIEPEQRSFAHALIDSGAVDAVHGHSSHHTQGLEIRRDKPILYGCGDFLNDYEGISGYESYRGDLALMYVAAFDSSGRSLVELRVLPFEIRGFVPRAASAASAEWVESMLTREGADLGTVAALGADGSVVVKPATRA